VLKEGESRGWDYVGRRGGLKSDEDH